MTGYVCHVSENIPGAVYIGRTNVRRRLAASPFANPFVIGQHGDRQMVLRKFGDFLNVLIWGGYHVEEFIALRGMPLACWCRRSDQTKTPGRACHGDVILQMLDRYTDDDLRSFIKEAK